MRQETYNRAEGIKNNIRVLEARIKDLNLVLFRRDGKELLLHHFDARIQSSYNEDIRFDIPKSMFKRIAEELREETLEELTLLDEEFKEV